MYEVLKKDERGLINNKIASSMVKFTHEDNDSVIMDISRINISGEVLMHFMNSNWDAVLSTGVDNIDRQHQEIFRLINNLVSAMNEEKSKVEIIKALDSLEEHAIRHINEEEAIQKENNYPGLEIQQMQHEEFKECLRDIRSFLETREISTLFIIHMQQKIFKWCRKHMLNADKDLGEFLISSRRN
ncbi:bacteriohemerythrin [Clostridium beijerinckii]|uniref:Hemerythrin n=3 Tax=Clostridium TaxID=1485 RepID=A0AAX0B691_CLOBE|nr:MULTISPECIES: hemerythrin family protein [Clostridium]MBA8932455.1 hemerythrin [Clostridium beijerinckii]NOW06593.1 hemerythrin [Clostridium beijerinckii]NRT37575.1 hemerythrin [Clostridium beijerinckii]NRT48682.1 hemerythrin [Clostridium beijerinckii]NRT74256.1 hemerythrin [Clostridium beijerinckii]